MTHAHGALDDELTDALAPADAPDDGTILAAVADAAAGAEPAPMPWQVDSIGAADWAARKIRRALREIDAIEDYRAQVIAQLDEAVAAERARQEPVIEFFESRLYDWLDREIASDESKRPRKSRTLPCGLTVKRTAGREVVEVEDQDAFVAWASSTGHDFLLRPPKAPQPDKAALAKAAWQELTATTGAGVEVEVSWQRDDDGRLMTPDGEVVPGVRAVANPDRHSIVLPTADEGGDA